MSRADALTLVEFLAPLSGSSQVDRVLAAMFYFEEAGETSWTGADLRKRLVDARVAGSKGMNVHAVLGGASPRVHVAGKGAGSNLWALTETGRQHVRDRLGLTAAPSQTRQDVGTLRKLAAQMADPVVRSYVDEAVLCLEVDARRAAIVFLWTGAIRHLQESALAQHGGQAVTAAIKRHDPKVRDVRSAEDFAQVKDKFALLGFRDLKMLDKGEWQTLQEGLDLRNRCGHPTKYLPGQQKASAFVEDLLSIAF